VEQPVDKRIRTTLRIIVVFVTLVAWWTTYSQTRSMGLLMSLGVPLSLGMEGWAIPTSLALFTAMWAVMMIAMMLPSSYPTLLLYRSVSRERNPAQPSGTFLFASGYFFVWTITGVLFYLAYVLVGYWRSRTLVSDTHILQAAGAALIVAGAYQWSRMKIACLAHCRSPLHFVMNHWRTDGGARRSWEPGTDSTVLAAAGV
jgi:predicted metal-binding membrane protein